MFIRGWKLLSVFDALLEKRCSNSVRKGSGAWDDDSRTGGVVERFIAPVLKFEIVIWTELDSFAPDVLRPLWERVFVLFGVDTRGLTMPYFFSPGYFFGLLILQSESKETRRKNVRRSLKAENSS